MIFEWDPAKARSNKKKHGISFREATEVFKDDYSSAVSDPDHSFEEERFILFGKTYRHRYVAVAFTERGDRIRIISARQMTRQERKAYEQSR